MIFFSLSSTYPARPFSPAANQFSFVSDPTSSSSSSRAPQLCKPVVYANKTRKYRCFVIIVPRGHSITTNMSHYNCYKLQIIQLFRLTQMGKWENGKIVKIKTQAESITSNLFAYRYRRLTDSYARKHLGRTNLQMKSSLNLEKVPRYLSRSRIPSTRLRSTLVFKVISTCLCGCSAWFYRFISTEKRIVALLSLSSSQVGF